MTVRRRPHVHPRRDHPARHAVPPDCSLDLAASPRSSTGSSSRARTASRSAARPASRRRRPSPSAIEVMRAAATAIAGRVPFLPGTGTRAPGRDARAHRRGSSGSARRQRSSSRRTTPAAHAAGPLRLVRPRSPASSPSLRSSSTTCRSARRSTSRRRRSAACAAPSRTSSGSRRRPRLRARLVRLRVRRGLHRPVGDRAALLSDARARRRRAPELRRRTSRRGRRRALRRVRGRRPRARARAALELHPLVEAAFIDEPRACEVDHGAPRVRRRTCASRSRRPQRQRRSASWSCSPSSPARQPCCSSAFRSATSPRWCSLSGFDHRADRLDPARRRCRGPSR